MTAELDRDILKWKGLGGKYTPLPDLRPCVASRWPVGVCLRQAEPKKTFCARCIKAMRKAVAK